MILIRVIRNGRVTIPAALRRQLGISAGDLIELQVEGDHLAFRKKLTDKGQAYFWTWPWQAAEREAQKDFDAGRIKEFASLEEVLADLHYGS